MQCTVHTNLITKRNQQAASIWKPFAEEHVYPGTRNSYPQKKAVISP